jgi:hypothetical protein
VRKNLNRNQVEIRPNTTKFHLLNRIFRPVSGRPNVHNFCLKHTEERIFLPRHVSNTNCQHEEDLKQVETCSSV